MIIPRLLKIVKILVQQSLLKKPKNLMKHCKNSVNEFHRTSRLFKTSNIPSYTKIILYYNCREYITPVPVRIQPYSKDKSIDLLNRSCNCQTKYKSQKNN